MTKVLRILVCGVACLIFGQATARAVILDWNSVNWSAEALSQSFDIDATNPGNDITITITGDTSKIASGYPNESNELTGGLGSGANSLKIRSDFTKRDQELTITITFNYTAGVSNVNFTIFDIDSDGSYIDQIRNISANLNGGSTFGVTTTTNGSALTASGSGLSKTLTGTSTADDATGSGNANLNFGTNVLTQVSFTWGNTSSSDKDPNPQHIALYDISYKKKNVPEVHPAIAAMGLCGLVSLGRMWRRARRR